MSASSSSWSVTSAFRGSVAATAAIIGRVPRAVCLPPDLQRAREPRADGARAARAARARRPRARDRRQLARRDGRARRPAGATELDGVDVLHRRAQGRARARRTSPASAARSPTAPSSSLEMDCDFSHDPDDVPRLIAAAGDADLVLGSRYVPGGGIENWGVAAALRLARRLALRADPARRAGPRPDRRLQVLPARGAGARSTSTRSARGLRVPDRDDLPRAPRGLPRRRGADHVRRPRGRRLEDEPRDRARGDLAGAAISRAGAAGRLR